MILDLYNEDATRIEHVAAIEADNISRVEPIYKPNSTSLKVEVRTSDEKIYECDYVIPNT